LKVLLVSALIILADQITKLVVKGFSFTLINFQHSGLNHGDSIPVLNNFFHITLVENPGIAFGIDLHPDVKLIFSIFTIIASISLVVYLFTIKNQDLSIRLPVAVIIGGAFGNLIDRIFYGWFYGYGNILAGSVVDFLDIRFANLFVLDNTVGIYVFNIADLAITLGAVSFIYFLLRKKKESGIEKTLSAQEENSEGFICNTFYYFIGSILKIIHPRN